MFLVPSSMSAVVMDQEATAVASAASGAAAVKAAGLDAETMRLVTSR